MTFAAPDAPAKAGGKITWLDGAPGSPLSARQFGILGALWALGSLLLVFFRPGYTFPPFELLDSWIYTSYQWDLGRQISDFGPTYYGSRLSWILPGAFFHHFLPPITAEICFKLCFSALLAGAVSVVVHAGAGFRWVMVGLLATVFCPQVIGALHADYCDTAVFTYAAITMACITLAKDSSRWWLWIAAAGCAFALMAVANLGALSFIGVGIGVYHLAWLRWGLGRHLLAIGLYCAGAAAIICLLGYIHTQVGGRFYFLEQQVNMILYFKGVKHNPWSPTDFQWIPTAHWLILPGSALVWGLTRSFFPGDAEARIQRLTRALTAALACSLGLAAIVEFRGTGAVLSLYYYGTFHLAMALPLLFVCCASGLGGSTLRPIRMAVLMAGLVLIVLAFTPIGHCARLSFLNSVVPRPEWVEIYSAAALLLVAGAGLIISRLISRPRLPYAESLFLGLMFLSLPRGFHGTEISDHLRERYTAVHAAYRTVAREFSPGSFRYWIDATHRDGVSLCSTKLWGYRLLTLKAFPEFDQPDLTGHTIIVPGALGKGTDILARANEVLAARDLEPIAPRIIPVPGTAGTGFDLVCFGMRLRPFDPERNTGRTATSEAFASYTSAEPDYYTNHLGSVTNGPRTGELVTTETGYPVFRRTHHDDHLATPYQQLPITEGDSAREFAIVLEMPSDGACEVTVQDDQFRGLQHVPLTKSGHICYNFLVPADAKGLRVVFASPDAPATPLPTRITLYRIKR